MAKGTYSKKRTYYYSKALPEGEGKDVGYDPMLYKEIQYVLGNFHNLDKSKPVSNQMVKDLQLKLIDVGYLDSGDDDGYIGEMTMGSMKRYMDNYSTTHIWEGFKDTIKFWD